MHGVDKQLGNIFTAFSAGLTAGAFVWGVLVDKIGKSWGQNKLASLLIQRFTQGGTGLSTGP